MKLSIILPAIRTEKWDNVYLSIKNSWSGDFELIIVSPYKPSDDLLYKGNVKWIQDWGCVPRCMQLGLLESTGEYVTWVVDDGFYLKDALDNAYEEFGFDDCLSLKYTEGDNPDPLMFRDIYYDMHHHKALSYEGVPLNSTVFSFGILPTEKLKEVGGFDSCTFEGMAMMGNDLSIRLLKNGNKFIIGNWALVLTYLPNTEGDHAPIHYSQIYHDEPKFKEMYKDDSNKDRIIIDINNWKKSPEKWRRRFTS